MSEDREKLSTPDEVKAKVRRRRIRTWGGLAVGSVAAVWGAIDGGLMHYIVALIGFGIVEPAEALRVLRR